ncbi:hypothetical protein FHR83_006741 [Actinoplanes campanulatus]|uniref:Uncharacterized protein n=1 Tax=Actinoplanes campanulatus TaxID=113559 RepID=A0A7W5AMZ1_9ACTN|nr:hypothetical protein [Actinoplanes campanulatus]MBB3099035.1 hypothetical protein [Actinoplanes campanulatus]GGN39338.1 hypothetical protein GCM10010109_67150 [Actinoplanes campanulatus]GID40194.1 hypothetical protein Aca09nite_67000 [Actinoplanes campanulatus]
MSISEAFDGVIPARPVSPAAPRLTPPAKVVRIHPDAPTDSRTRRMPRAVAVRRLARVVYTDAADSWITEEQSPSAKTVWHTDHTAHLDKPWKPYQAWAYCYRPVAVVVALALDGVKWLLIHPARILLTGTGTFAIYLIYLVTH